jgi:hypothetical protein
MPIIFPRSFPSGLNGLFMDVDYKLNIVQSGQRTVGGAVAPIDYAEPFWSSSYKTPSLNRAQIDEWEAWLDSLRGSTRLFWATHPEKLFPRAYRNSGWGALTRATVGGAFPGWTNLVAIGNSTDGQRDLITIGSGSTTLPALFDLRPGDLINIDRPLGRRSLHRVTNGENAGGNIGSAGGQWVGMIEPSVPPDTVVGAAVRLQNCAFKARKIKHELPQSAARKARPGQVSIDCIEDLTT